MSKYNNINSSRRKSSNPVISLTQFAHAKSKGTRKAIEKCKQKKQSKFNRNANLLREYRKAMKNEGYDAGKGGSRKRSLEKNDGMKDSHADNVEYEIDSDMEQQKKRRKFYRSDPFAKAKAKAQQSKEEKKQQIERRKKEIKENEKKMKLKKIKTKKLVKRTSRGQPIMKNVVGDLLEKIRKTT